MIAKNLLRFITVSLLCVGSVLKAGTPSAEELCCSVRPQAAVLAWAFMNRLSDPEFKVCGSEYSMDRLCVLALDDTEALLEELNTLTPETLSPSFQQLLKTLYPQCLKREKRMPYNWHWSVHTSKKSSLYGAISDPAQAAHFLQHLTLLKQANDGVFFDPKAYRCSDSDSKFAEFQKKILPICSKLGHGNMEDGTFVWHRQCQIGEKINIIKNAVQLSVLESCTSRRHKQAIKSVFSQLSCLKGIEQRIAWAMTEMALPWSMRKEMLTAVWYLGCLTFEERVSVREAFCADTFDLRTLLQNTQEPLTPYYRDALPEYSHVSCPGGQPESVTDCAENAMRLLIVLPLWYASHSPEDGGLDLTNLKSRMDTLKEQGRAVCRLQDTIAFFERWQHDAGNDSTQSHQEWYDLCHPEQNDCYRYTTLPALLELSQMLLAVSDKDMASCTTHGEKYQYLYHVLAPNAQITVSSDFDGTVEYRQNNVVTFEVKEDGKPPLSYVLECNAGVHVHVESCPSQTCT